MYWTSYCSCHLVCRALRISQTFPRITACMHEQRASSSERCRPHALVVVPDFNVSRLRSTWPQETASASFFVCASSGNARFLFLGHMPDHDVVVGHVDSWMTRVKVEADVVSSAREPRRVE